MNTAKGGDLLNRTVENYRANTRESYENGQVSDGSDEEKTPKVDKMDLDDPGSTGRSIRGTVSRPMSDSAAY